MPCFPPPHQTPACAPANKLVDADISVSSVISATYVPINSSGTVVDCSDWEDKASRALSATVGENNAWVGG